MWGTSATIGLVLVCLPSGSTDVAASPSQYIMTQPSGIPSLSPVLFMHVGNPYIPLFKFVLASFFSFIQTGRNPGVYDIILNQLFCHFSTPL